jgi:hypothetical protein
MGTQTKSAVCNTLEFLSLTAKEKDKVTSWNLNHSHIEIVPFELLLENCICLPSLIILHYSEIAPNTICHSLGSKLTESLSTPTVTGVLSFTETSS